ncbi:CocE/NonD family hydrolase [Parasphingorhabdus sp.]|uniref:CocE/NonD family hydrolase n=1 Tax=Parasphingorhabdus sp. TaxID=2709688 RepID=UPI0030016FAE
MKKTILLAAALCTTPAAIAFSAPVAAQDYSKYSDEALKSELADIADETLAVLVPMRDGIGLSTNIYTPKKGKGPFPVILWKTPYSEHDIKGGTLRYAIKAVQRGFVFVVQNERGRYFSEGEFEILGKPQSDGYDTLSWLAAQEFSNGNIGTLGCSSSAEWQLALAGMDHPAHKAMVPMSAGAGIGKVGRFQEQGNWYTGGVPRSLFIPWLYNVDNPLRAQIPSGLDQPTRARIAAYNSLAAAKPKVEWKDQIRHLPPADIMSDLGEPEGTFDTLIARTPGDPAWREGGLYHEDMGWGVPSLWFNSWYDVSIGPNMELFNHARAAGKDKETRDNQYAVIAPVVHCAYSKLGRDTVVGDRDMGDTSFDVDGAIFGWFDRWLKGDRKAFPASTPHVQYFNMGENRWKSAPQWPPATAITVRFYLRSDGNANSLYGDGKLSTAMPPADEPGDQYHYDPLNPVQTIGGGDCCNGGIVIPGAADQRVIEARNDVLVYTSDPLEAPLDVTGFVDAVLNISSSAKDTDFAVKLVDVAPDGTAWIIGDTIQRARYRDGYDEEKLMNPDQVYTIRPTPMTTSIRFGKGHRIRVEVTSSNFPKFVRNLNGGGNVATESKATVAKNEIHHDAENPSYIDLPVVE